MLAIRLLKQLPCIFFVFLKLFPRYFNLFRKGTGSVLHTQLMKSCGGTEVHIPLFSSNLIHNSYIHYIRLNASTCFERHPPILRRSMSLIVHVCNLWYSHSLQVAVLCTCKCTRRPPAEDENTRGCIHVQLTSLTS